MNQTKELEALKEEFRNLENDYFNQTPNKFDKMALNTQNYWTQKIGLIEDKHEDLIANLKNEQINTFKQLKEMTSSVYTRIPLKPKSVKYSTRSSKTNLKGVKIPYEILSSRYQEEWSLPKSSIENLAQK